MSAPAAAAGCHARLSSVIAVANAGAVMVAGLRQEAPCDLAMRAIPAERETKTAVRARCIATGRCGEAMTSDADLRPAPWR